MVILKDKLRKLMKFIYILIKNIYRQEELKKIITLLSFSFILYSIIVNVEKLDSYSLYNFSLWNIFFSVAFTCLSIFMNACAWKFLCFWLGFNYLSIDLINLFLKTNIFKYLPSGILHFAERLREIKVELSFRSSMEAVFIEPFLMLASGLFCASFGNFNLVIKIIFLLPMLIFLPDFRGLLRTSLDKIISSKITSIDPSYEFINTKANLEEVSNNSYPFKPLFFEILFIFFRFIGFFYCLIIFGLNNNLAFLDWFSSFSLAWVCGLIVPGAPGGIGVFEAILLFLVRGSVEDYQFIYSLILYRLISTISDVFMYLFSRRIRTVKE